MSILHDVSRWSARAREHVCRRGFARDIAADAVQNALVALAEKSQKPGFVPPFDPKAYLFVRAVQEAHALVRVERKGGATSGVGGLRAPVSVSLDAAASVTVTEFTDDEDTNAHERDPDWSHRVETRADIYAEWHDAVGEALSELEPQEQRVLENELERTQPLDSAERKRLARVRQHARRELARFGIRHAFPVVVRRRHGRLAND